MTGITVVTMSGKRYPLEMDDISSLADLERQVNKLTGIKFAEQALELIYDEEEISAIQRKYLENGPAFIHTTLNKFVSSVDEIKDGDVLRVVLSKH